MLWSAAPVTFTWARLGLHDCCTFAAVPGPSLPKRCPRGPTASTTRWCSCGRMRSSGYLQAVASGQSMLSRSSRSAPIEQGFAVHRRFVAVRLAMVRYSLGLRGPCGLLDLEHLKQGASMTGSGVGVRVRTPTYRPVVTFALTFRYRDRARARLEAE